MKKIDDQRSQKNIDRINLSLFFFEGGEYALQGNSETSKGSGGRVLLVRLWGRAGQESGTIYSFLTGGVRKGGGGGDS